MKHKTLALFLSLAMILTAVLPGTLAVSVGEDGSGSTLTVGTPSCTCGTEDGIHAEGCSLYVNPDQPEEGAVCTCGTEDGIHAEGCSLYVNPDQPEEDAVCTCGTEDETHAEDCPLYGVNADDQEKDGLTLKGEEEDGLEAVPPEDWDDNRYLEGVVSFTKVAPLVQADTAPEMRTLRRLAAPRAGGNTTPTPDTSGVVLNKAASYNSTTKDYTITLEAYATGTSSSSTTLTDVVLVLDTSGSMWYPMENNKCTKVYGNTNNRNRDGKGNSATNAYAVTGHDSGNYVSNYRTYYVIEDGKYVPVWYYNEFDFRGWTTDSRFWKDAIIPKETEDDPRGEQFYTIQEEDTCLYALKSSVNTFIGNVFDASEDNQIAIVPFGTDVGTVTGFTKSKTTLTTAVNNLKADGSTNTGDAMKKAKDLLNASAVKNNGHNKVVVMFTDGEPTQNDVYSETVANNAISASKDLKGANVTVYTIGIFSDANATLPIPAGTIVANKFMHYVSSNYPNASAMDNPGNLASGLNGKSYYLSAGSAAELKKIFEDISQEIGGANNENLGTSTEIKDVITPYFTVPANATDIKLYTADCTAVGTDGALTFGSRATAPTGVTATITDRTSTTDGTLSVTGFDFSANWCGSHNGTASGKKLIIEFTVKPREGFLGGNNVPTNGDTSGMYDKNGTAIKKFAVPEVNVPIEAVTIDANDKNVYLTQVPTDAQLKDGVTIKCGDVDITDPSKLEDWQKAFVTITETFTMSTGFDATADGTYTVTAKVSPTGTAVSTLPGVVATEQSKTETKNICVFKPELTFKDSTVYYGDNAPTSYDANKDGDPVWKHGTGTSEKLSTDTGVTMIGTEPTLNLTYTPEAGKITGTPGKINTKNDFAVDVTVKIGEGTSAKDVTTYTTFEHSKCNNTETAPMNGKFWLHVKTCQLTVTKAGGAANESYVFDVYKDNEKYTEVTTWGNESVTIYELPVGTYSIKENTGWSWRYTPSYSDDVTLSSTNTSGTITCTNTKKTDKWLNGFSTIVENIYGESHTSGNTSSDVSSGASAD